MSSNEFHRRSKRFRTLCAACQERKARFKYRGEVRADRDHTLCFECYRGEINRTRARRLAEPIAPRITQSALEFQESVGRPLNEGRLEHRRRMLEHLQRPSSAAS